MPEYLLCLLAVLIVVVLLHMILLGGKPLFCTVRGHLAYFGILWALAIAWDGFEIWRGHWFYSRDFLVCDPPLLGVPVEDYVFCFVVPYLCAVVFRLVQRGDK